MNKKRRVMWTEDERKALRKEADRLLTDPDYLARLAHTALYGSQERRVCTAEAPMPEADKDRYRWSHPDAEIIGRAPAINHVDLCRCPHCHLTFTSFPRPR